MMYNPLCSVFLFTPGLACLTVSDPRLLSSTLMTGHCQHHTFVINFVIVMITTVVRTSSRFFLTFMIRWIYYFLLSSWNWTHLRLAWPSHMPTASAMGMYPSLSKPPFTIPVMPRPTSRVRSVSMGSAAVIVKSTVSPASTAPLWYNCQWITSRLKHETCKRIGY